MRIRQLGVEAAFLVILIAAFDVVVESAKRYDSLSTAISRLYLPLLLLTLIPQLLLLLPFTPFRRLRYKRTPLTYLPCRQALLIVLSGKISPHQKAITLLALGGSSERWKLGLIVEVVGAGDYGVLVMLGGKITLHLFHFSLRTSSCLSNRTMTLPDRGLLHTFSNIIIRRLPSLNQTSAILILPSHWLCITDTSLLVEARQDDFLRLLLLLSIILLIGFIDQITSFVHATVSHF